MKGRCEQATDDLTGPVRLVSANLEHDLATLPAARDSLKRRPGLRERKNRVDLRAQLACVRERCQLQQLLMVWVAARGKRGKVVLEVGTD